MTEYSHINETILWSYFCGTLSPIQKQEVDDWIAGSEENREIARNIQSIYQASDALNCIRETDATAALKKVKERIRHPKKRDLLVQLQRIAAVLIIPLLVATIYFALKSDPVEYIEIRTNPGMTAKVDLPDGTKVWLNSRSYLKHPSRFTSHTRDVELTGEAYFDVEPDKHKPFIVNTPFDIKAEVLGTEFNMEAYETEKEVRTTLVSGSVRLTFKGEDNDDKSFVMKPDEEFVYNHKNKKLSVNKPYIPTLTAWKDGMVILKNTPFEETLKILSKRFNVEFIVKNDKLYNGSYTGPFNEQHLQLILDYFRFSTGIQYRFVDPKTDGHNLNGKTVVELY